MYQWLGYTHAVVNHGEEEYANGDIFTNSIEGFWSHFRRMIVGCYHDEIGRASCRERV